MLTMYVMALSSSVPTYNKINTKQKMHYTLLPSKPMFTFYDDNRRRARPASTNRWSANHLEINQTLRPKHYIRRYVYRTNNTCIINIKQSFDQE